MTLKCDFCHKEFKSDKILKTHKKTAKYCLKLQKDNMSNVVLGEFICECKKTFTLKNSLDRHKIICDKIKIKNEIETKTHDLENKIIRYEILFDQYEKKEKELREQLDKKDLQIKELQDKMERITTKAIDKAISKPTVQNNTIKNTVNNKYSYLTPLTLDAEYIKNKVDMNFDKTHFLNGASGVADFTEKYLLRDTKGRSNYIFTDISRGLSTFRRKDGKQITNIKDKDCRILINEIIDPVIKKSQDIYKDLRKEQPQSYESEFERDMRLIAKLNSIKGIKLYRSEFRDRIISKTESNAITLANEFNDRFIIESDNETETVLVPVEKKCRPDDEPYLELDDENILSMNTLGNYFYISYKNQTSVKHPIARTFYFNNKVVNDCFMYKIVGDKLNINCIDSGDFGDCFVRGNPIIDIKDPDVYAIRYLEDKSGVEVRYKDDRMERLYYGVS
jgi:hypothetical protein